MNQFNVQTMMGRGQALIPTIRYSNEIIRLLPFSSQFVRRKTDLQRAPKRSADLERARGGGWISCLYHGALRGVRGLFSKIKTFGADCAPFFEEECAVLTFSPRESEARLRLALSTGAVGVALLDLNGQYTDVNDAFCKITGYQRHELYRTTFRAITHPDDLQNSMEVKRRLLAGEQDTAIVQLRYITKFGPIVWIQSSASVVRDEEGIAIGLITFTEDISERKRAEEALRQSEANYRSLVEHSPYGICRTNREGKLLMANPALVQLLGYDSELELLTKELARDVYENPSDCSAVLHRCDDQILGNVSALLRWKRKDGKPLLLNAATRIVRQEDSSNSCFEMTVEDITERTILQEAVRQAQRMEAVGQFAGGIAHDFNNLVTVILGQSEMLLRYAPLEEVARQRLREIKDAAERARWVTAQLLVYGGRRSMEFQPIDVNALIRELHQLFERLIGEDILLSTELTATLGRVRADYGLLGQVMMNLVANARDAMPSGGNLTIKSADVEVDQTEADRHPGVSSGSFVMFSVKDTGMGIENNVLQHIFEPFFSTKGPDKGTGLGLAMVQSIVLQSGGFVTVSSQPGQGSVFSVFLPRVPDVARNPMLLREDEDFPMGSETCLIVEDAPPIRALTYEYLATSGYRVLQAANGEEALTVARLHDGRIDLLISDVVMPGMSGNELAARLAANRPEMKVLLVSGYSDEKVIQHGVMNPLASVLPKPYTQGLLLRKVRQVLNG